MKSFRVSLCIMFALALSSVAQASTENPFTVSKASTNQMQLADNHESGDSSTEEAKCGKGENEGSNNEARCGEGKCDSGKEKSDAGKNKKMTCGSGRCGSN